MILSGLEDEVGTVLNAIGSDSRIGHKFLRFCIPHYFGDTQPKNNLMN